MCVCVYVSVCVCPYIRLFSFDVVPWEDAGPIPGGAAPPLSLPLADQDDVALPEGQISWFRRLVRVQSHKLCRRTNDSSSGGKKQTTQQPLQHVFHICLTLEAVAVVWGLRAFHPGRTKENVINPPKSIKSP